MPMDLSAVRDLCDAAAPCMADLLGVSDYTTTIYYRPCGNAGWVADCGTNPPYKRAEITIDPAEHDDESDALDSLRHELIHVLLDEFGAYRGIVQAVIAADSAADAAERKAWTLGSERTVLRVERLLDGLGWTPTAMAGQDTACSSCEHAWRAAAPEGTKTVECPSCGARATLGHVPAT